MFVLLKLSAVVKQWRDKLCDRRALTCSDSKNHQRALDAMQINLETESRNKVEAMRVKKKLEQDINELELTLDSVNKAKAETERNFKKYQQQIRDLQQVHSQYKLSTCTLCLKNDPLYKPS